MTKVYSGSSELSSQLVPQLWVSVFVSTLSNFSKNVAKSIFSISDYSWYLIIEFRILHQLPYDVWSLKSAFKKNFVSQVNQNPPLSFMFLLVIFYLLILTLLLVYKFHFSWLCLKVSSASPPIMKMQWSLYLLWWSWMKSLHHHSLASATG